MIKFTQNLSGQKKWYIMRDWEYGWKGWRICQDHGIDREQLIKVLVEREAIPARTARMRVGRRW